MWIDMWELFEKFSLIGLVAVSGKYQFIATEAVSGRVP